MAMPSEPTKMTLKKCVGLSGRSTSINSPQTDLTPQHDMCSPTWCPYKQAEASNTVGTYKHTNNLPLAVMNSTYKHTNNLPLAVMNSTYKHTNNLPLAVMNRVKPIFKDLAHPDLLRKCVDGYTQNANESLNCVIWKYCPKTKNNGLTTVNIAISIAVCLFNDGASTLKTQYFENYLGKHGHFCWHILPPVL
eukprot:TRINITY_DN88658_c0_g1_i4.p1 TRINITY_DN88658_c0_g1~~TRINITY_DN88658_c0_g1_i4.p1  ORF type:complete len:192 (-),score=30.36 TRINITY_DN88658_c0_g1_i4:167-742(-)